MNFGQLLQAAREDLDDLAGNQDRHHLLRETTALRLYNEAIHEACRRARLLVDRSTTAVCSYAVTAGQSVITLDSRVIKVRLAMLTSQPTPLRRLYVADMDERLSGWESHTGTPDSYIADYETGKLCLYRRPEQNDTLKLAVVRLPMNDLTSLSSVPEIPTQYHPALVPYVVAAMRSADDTELYDPRKAALEIAKFDREFGPKRSALDETWENSQPFSEYE